MIFEQAHAKINPALDITGRRENGYHDVRMIMQSVGLCDDLSFSKGKSGAGVTLKTDSPVLEKERNDGGDNLILKAARLLSEAVGVSFDADITLVKRIPIAAGLGGGSSDAAATLRGLNRLYDLGLSCDELRKIGVKIGADVPFCVEGGLSLAEGIGEILTPLPAVASIPIVICKPDVSVSTPAVYKAYDLSPAEEHPDVDGMIAAIKAYDNGGMVSRLGNVLEPVTKGMHPVIGEIERKALEAGATGSLMSGSGPTVFATFNSEKEAKTAAEALGKAFPGFFCWAGTFFNAKRPRFE